MGTEGNPPPLWYRPVKKFSDLRGWRRVATFNDVLTQELGAHQVLHGHGFHQRRKSRWTFPSTVSK